MGFLYSQLFVTPPYPTTDFSGQTIIVTGANVGLGREAARHFVRLNAAKVIIAVRSLEKGEAAKRDIEASTKRNNVIEVWHLDLAKYASVQAFASRVAELPRVDVVVENAAIAVEKFVMLEKDESTITVNVVSTLLLAVLLLPTLRKSAKAYGTTPRLVIVSSEVHAWAKLPEWREASTFEKLSDKDAADMKGRYPVSKLVLNLCVRALAQQLGDSPVIINMLNPGLCHSELARDAGWQLYLIKLILARTAEVGSRTLVSAAAGGKETHGEYLSDCQITNPSDFILSPEGHQAQEKVWKELCAKLEAIQPGIVARI